MERSDAYLKGADYRNKNTAGNVDPNVANPYKEAGTERDDWNSGYQDAHYQAWEDAGRPDGKTKPVSA